MDASYVATNNPFASARPGPVPSSFSSQPGPSPDAAAPQPPQMPASMYPSYQQYGAYQPSSFIGGTPTPPAPLPQGSVPGEWQWQSSSDMGTSLQPEYLERVVEVPKIHVEHREKIVEVPQTQIVDRVVEVPQIQEVLNEVPGPVERRLITREVPKIEVRQVERIVEVPQVEYVDRIIEVPVVHEIVRKIPRVEVHEIPIERVIQVPKKVVQEIEQPTYKPVPHLVQQQVEREIPVPRMQMQTMEVVKQVAVPTPFDDGTPELPPAPQQQAAPPVLRTEVAPPVITAVTQSRMERPAPVVTQGQSVVVQSARPGYMTPPTPPAVAGSMTMMPASVASVTVGPAIPVSSLAVGTAMGSMSAVPMQSGLVASMHPQSMQMIPGSMQLPQSQTAVNPYASVVAATAPNPFASVAVGAASMIVPPQGSPPQSFAIPQTGNPYAMGSFQTASGGALAPPGSMVITGTPPSSFVTRSGTMSQPGSFYRTAAGGPAVPYSSQGQTPPTPPASGGGGDVFASMDRNHDGVVTREEFEQSLQSGAVLNSSVIVR